MKLMNVGIVLFIIFLAASFSYSQTPAFSGAKIAIINTEAFSDDKAGITRLLNAINILDVEFKPKQDELIALNARLEKLAKDIQALQNKLNNPNSSVPFDKNVAQAEIESKNDEGSRLQIEMKRKQEDAKAQYEKRSTVVIDPIKTDIGNALDAFAKARGIDIILDGKKLADSGILLSLNTTVDITAAFVKDYNAKHTGVPVKKN